MEKSSIGERPDVECLHIHASGVAAEGDHGADAVGSGAAEARADVEDCALERGREMKPGGAAANADVGQSRAKSSRRIAAEKSALRHRPADLIEALIEEDRATGRLVKGAAV